MKFQEFDAGADRHSHVNAYWLGKASELAYLDGPGFEAAVGDWGVRCRHVSAKDTQAHVVASRNLIIVAFRGTETNPGDIASDLKFKRTRWVGPGEVHQGFNTALEVAWDETLNAIGALTQPGQTLWFTGHSLGGALAVLAAMRWTFEARKPDIKGVYTLGQPRVGDGAFCAAFASALGKRTFRYINDRDPVPRVPILGYSHVGRALQFDDRGRLESGFRFWLRMLKLARASSAQVKEALKTAVGDHAAAKYVACLLRTMQAA